MTDTCINITLPQLRCGPWADTLPGTPPVYPPPPVTATAADGTHPTGMYFCLKNIKTKATFIFLSRFTDLVLSFVFAVCPESCRREGKSCYFDKDNNLRCCDRQCQGGCTGGGPGDCIACKNVFSSGYCKDYCSPTTFEVITIYHKQVKSKIGKMSRRSKNRARPFEFV